MPETLTAHIRKYITLTGQEAAEVSLAIRQKVCAKKEILLREGQQCRELYFVSPGIRPGHV